MKKLTLLAMSALILSSCSSDDSYQMSPQETVKTFLQVAYIDDNEQAAQMYLSPEILSNNPSFTPNNLIDIEITPISTHEDHENQVATYRYMFKGVSEDGNERIAERTTVLSHSTERWIITKI